MRNIWENSPRHKPICSISSGKTRKFSALLFSVSSPNQGKLPQFPKFLLFPKRPYPLLVQNLATVGKMRNPSRIWDAALLFIGDSATKTPPLNFRVNVECVSVPVAETAGRDIRSANRAFGDSIPRKVMLSIGTAMCETAQVREGPRAIPGPERAVRIWVIVTCQCFSRARGHDEFGCFWRASVACGILEGGTRRCLIWRSQSSAASDIVVPVNGFPGVWTALSYRALKHVVGQARRNY